MQCRVPELIRPLHVCGRRECLIESSRIANIRSGSQFASKRELSLKLRWIFHVSREFGCLQRAHHVVFGVE